MNPLVLAGDLWHPASVVRQGLQDHGAFDWLEDGEEWNTDLLGGRPLVVLAKANQRHAGDTRPWADEAVGVAFSDFVRTGGGLLVVHAGTSGYQEIPSLRGLSAGAFDHHPPPCPVTIVPTNGHLLCDGVEEFTETDEHYFMHFDDPAAEVFLHSVSEHGTQPAGWTRHLGLGRICVLTPGHNPAVWRQPSFQRILRNCLEWVGAEGGPRGMTS